LGPDDIFVGVIQFRKKLLGGSKYSPPVPTHATHLTEHMDLTPNKLPTTFGPTMTNFGTATAPLQPQSQPSLSSCYQAWQSPLSVPAPCFMGFSDQPLMPNDHIGYPKFEQPSPRSHSSSLRLHEPGPSLRGSTTPWNRPPGTPAAEGGGAGGQLWGGDSPQRWLSPFLGHHKRSDFLEGGRQMARASGFQVYRGRGDILKGAQWIAGPNCTFFLCILVTNAFSLYLLFLFPRHY
jgi:hypothetical protein